jgi:hypothetical protein
MIVLLGTRMNDAETAWVGFFCTYSSRKEEKIDS